MKLNLTLACETYALQSGSVKPNGIEMNCLKMSVGEIFERQGPYAAFDVAEMSLSRHSITAWAR
jgi:4,5-dihydroxyphthalate decarboxylase